MKLVKSTLQFKRIQLEDLKKITAINFNFKPYSDFNALSIWTYNTEEVAEYCFYNENLVVKFTDYFTSEIFITLLGINKIPETLEEIFNYTNNNNIDKTLKLIPEITVNQLGQSRDLYVVNEDVDNFDYIYSLEDLVKLEGSRRKDERNLCNKFMKTYPKNSVDVLDINDQCVKPELKKIVDVWLKNKKDEGMGSKAERGVEISAFERLLKYSQNFNVICQGLRVEEKYIAFSVSEPIDKDYVMASFTKADISYKGSFQFIERERARYFLTRGYTFLNLEQDLGVPGIRQAKKSWGPKTYLKKYTVKRK